MLTTSQEDTIIRLQDLFLDYGEHEIVKDVSLNIHRHKTTVILGPSGVGKSTILKAILGILKPRSGEVFIRQEPISQLPEKELVRIRIQMAMVFQNGALFDSMTIADNVSFRMRELGLAGAAKIDERVDEVLKFVGLSDVKHKMPAQLSGGMRKRAAIARALAPDPEIFLFDEPTVGLDPINRYNIEQLIIKLKERRNVTMVIVTHDVDSAYRLADDIVLLHEGRFIFEGKADYLKRSPDIRVRTFLNPDLAFSIQEKEGKEKENG
ncbi:MAG: ATP-binding cassette domain-containing protein [Candidatus Omnitrophica bacterium]|nr:ATP-binding cassette domain-containing protein [Candidatus Omnitrophota bacterium]